MKMSVKFRITLWYTLVMILVSAAVLAVMTSVSQTILARDTEKRVVQTVMDFSRRAVGPDGNIGKIPRFGFYERGVHLIMYSEDGEIIGGQEIVEFKEVLGLDDDKLETVVEDGGKYYVYTKKFRLRNGSSYWVRGIVSFTDENYAIKSAAKNNIILAVIMILIASCGGYFIVRKALLPVNKISDTAKEISRSRDLSQRINIGSGNDEIHSLANTFDEMLARIEQTMEREKQFTSDASHELRTPLAVILSECEYMTDCAENLEEIKESAYSVKDHAEKMSKLIGELLMISRMDKNAVKLEFEKVDISELLNFVCDEQEDIHAHDIGLKRNIDEGIAADCDRSMIMRLFINLISNAYTYGKKGGSITVSLYRRGEDVVFSVKDDGIGISEDDIPKIWERFYQADPARSSENGNSGLGLYMVKWIAECHGGKVSCESRLGVGSVFTFVMPINGK